MKIKIIILAALLSAWTRAHADEWTPADTTREAAYAVLMLMDWRQTQDIARHKNIDESNELLGEDPRNGKINRYFVAAGALQLAIAYSLPAEWRKVWQYAGIELEFATVNQNRRIGLSVNF